MSKSRPISAQMNYAINEAIHIGASKRAIRGEGRLDSVIVGVDHLDGVRDAGKRLATYAKNQGIKKLYEIKPETITGYLAERGKTCAATTMRKEVSYVKKLEHVVRAAMPHSSIDWGTSKLNSNDVPHKTDKTVKTLVIPRELRESIVDQMEGQRSKAKIAVDIGGRIGCRAKECGHLDYDKMYPDAPKNDPKNRYGFGYIDIPAGPAGGAKGGRARSIPIVCKEDQDRIRELKQGNSGYVMGKPVQGQAIIKQIRIAMEKMGIYGKYKHNMEHAIRKGFAQEVYDIERRNGASKTVALDIVNNALGHGDGRRELDDTYVANQW